MTIFHILKYAVADDGIRREDYEKMPAELREKITEAVDAGGCRKSADACAILVKVVMEWEGE